MLRHLPLAVGLFLVGCGAAQITATPVRETGVAGETGVAASCAALSPARQFAGAHLVLVGVTLPGPTTRLGGRRVLGSPARVRVERYLKGHGPRTVTVDTAVRIGAHGVTVAEDGIEPGPGQRWKIYTSSRRQPFGTSICAGSRRVAPQDISARANPAGATERTVAPWRNPGNRSLVGCRSPSEPKPVPETGSGAFAPGCSANVS